LHLRLVEKRHARRRAWHIHRHLCRARAVGGMVAGQHGSRRGPAPNISVNCFADHSTRPQLRPPYAMQLLPRACRRAPSSSPDCSAPLAARS
jgi:hypothetical protein